MALCQLILVVSLTRLKVSEVIGSWGCCTHGWISPLMLIAEHVVRRWGSVESGSLGVCLWRVPLAGKCTALFHYVLLL